MLNQWRFDSPDWVVHPNLAPLHHHKVSYAESWSGHAAVLAGWDPARLVLPAVASSGKPNLADQEGAIRFWFNPFWSSASQGGNGPEDTACLFEIGAWSGKRSMAWWSLQVTPDGNQLVLANVVNRDAPLIALVTSVEWDVGQWHQISLTYSGAETRLFIDGAMVAIGPGISLLPTAPAGSEAGIALGSNTSGEQLAQGEFEELTTLPHIPSEQAIALHYQGLAGRASLGPLTPAEEAAELAMQAMLPQLVAASGAQPAGGAAMWPWLPAAAWN